MGAFLLSLLGGGWGLAKRGFALLGKLNIWQLLCIGLFCAAAIQTVRLSNRSDQLERANINLNEVRGELKRITDDRNKQKPITQRNIDKAEKGEREAKPIAEKIRNAPIVPGKCETPGIEILRNEI